MRSRASTWTAIGCAALTLAGVAALPAAANDPVTGPPRLWVRTYLDKDPTCSSDQTCGWATPRYRVWAEAINAGTALVVLCRRGGPDDQGNARVCRSPHDGLKHFWWVSVQPRTSGPGGVMRWLKSGFRQCSGPRDSYFRIRDPVSKRWSNSGRATTSCVD
jgi:hypothetical protein